MSWKIILKAPPFDVRYESNAKNSLQTLLRKTLDRKLDNHIKEFPNKNKFALPMNKIYHEQLMNLVSGQRLLETSIKDFYHLQDFYITDGDITAQMKPREYGSTNMLYHFELR